MFKMIFIVAAFTTAVIAPPVSAQTSSANYPYCMHVYGERGGDQMLCTFITLGECKASAAGRSATCLINPNLTSDERARWRLDAKRD